ncbi:1-acyl-sn-glycerol-3-phosphate acyltransferase [Nodularia spumigena CS-586/05]|uniref:1-acyl-sn-glycerol-3-phosphate acyltransferase n=1 Tax=Nodularia spumigena TaxID=70799 RepID=UPI002A4C252C|nr:1-acyl-sn-glycerol-3-phosphate acyltransferase [Nodularia spumigena CS-588/06]MDB9368827.1 1-acyl-sn-glycerol-3-phosphate acyltransferase [Nodularia spumigena CS-586/05]
MPVIYQHAEKLLKTQQEKASGEGYRFSWFDWCCLWYPPGWLVLFNRHWQHYHADPDGWNWVEYALFLVPGGFYLALLMRWLRLGCRSPKQEVDEFNPLYQKAFREEILAPIVKYYFRAELQENHNLPPHSPVIVAMNHAGMCFPWDFITLGYLLSKVQGWEVQPLASETLFEHPWMSWWLPPKWSQVLGAVRAEKGDFEKAIAQGKTLLYAPEGLRGPLKGWKQRYQLQKFDVSFMQLSDRYHIPILPVLCIGSESLHPWTVNLKKLQRLFKLPFLPISPLIIMLIIFPSMGVWAVRTRLKYFIQPVQKVNPVQRRAATYKQVQELREKLQIQIMELLSHAEAQRRRE